MKLLNYIYKLAGDTDILGMLSRENLEIKWVLEAGCHDGQDTLVIHEKVRPDLIIAFEPDTQARSRAQSLFRSQGLKVELHPFGLSNVNSKLYMNFIDGVEGSGSTYLAETGSSVVEVCRFDDFNFNLPYGGLLWLDVEGHARQALEGAVQNLSKLKAAKVEIQMHDMSEARISDYKVVNHIMISSGLLPVRAPIYPGYFGDILYINKRELSFKARLLSKALILLMGFLHGFLYPLIGKPKSNS